MQTLVLIYCDYFLWNNDCDFKLWFVGGSVLYGDSTALFSMNDQDLWQFAFDIGACDEFTNEHIGFKYGGCGERIGFDHFMGFTATVLLALSYLSFSIDACCDYFYGKSVRIQYWLSSGFVQGGYGTGCNIGSANNEANWIHWNVGAC